MSRSHIRAVAVAVGVIIAFPLLSSTALAHVTANPDEATSPYFRTALRVGHGCEGSPTTTVRVQIPEGVDSARAEVIPGWDVEVIRTKLDEPIEQEEGEPITERVSEIVWSGGNLSDDNFEEFGLNVHIADDAPEVLWFPTIQECEKGEHRWIEIPESVEEWGDKDEPAPYVINAMAGEAEPAADEQATEEAAVAPAAEEESSDAAMPMAIIGLIAGLLGLGAGVTALVRGGRRA